MTDQTPDLRDELLRAALHAETEGVTAGPDLLDRIRVAAPARSPQRGRWLLVAAALALVVGVGAALVTGDGGDGDQQVDVVDDSTTSTQPTGDVWDRLVTAFPCSTGYQTVFYLGPDASLEDADAMQRTLEANALVRSVRVVPTEEIASLLEEAAPGTSGDPSSLPSAYVATSATEEDDLSVRGAVSDLAGVVATSSSDCSGPPTEPTEERPTLVALVREDGWLVTVDLQTGQQTELSTYGDPNAEAVEGGPYFIDGVDLSPDGRWVYFSTCCEPAVGTTFRIPVTGGEPEQVALGAYPRLSPDGRYLATAGSESLWVTPVDQLGGATMPPGLAVSCCTSQLSWSPDGTQLAVINSTGGPDDPPEVLLFDWDGSQLTPADMGKPENPGSFASWTPDGRLNISSGGPVDDDRGLSQDASYRWLVWVDEAGVVREQAGHQSGDRPPIAGLPEAAAADW